MCEIDVTRLVFGHPGASEFSANQAELGVNAGKITWANAMQEAKGESDRFLSDDAKLQDMRDWAEATGAWGGEHIAEWSDDELEALFIQLVSCDIRDAKIDGLCEGDEIDWESIEAHQREGHISSNLVPAGDGRVYFLLES